MLGIGVLILREVLEASLIISVVYAATRGIPARGRWVGLGLGTGVAGALLVAAFAGYDHTMEAYREAVEERYRFYSYGDAMAIL